MAFGDLCLSFTGPLRTLLLCFFNVSVIKIESTLCQDKVDKRLKSMEANSLSLGFGRFPAFLTPVEKVY